MLWLEKGFAFIKYENQKSTVLAVDNFNGTTILGRTIRVDHVQKYKLPQVGELRGESSGRRESVPALARLADGWQL